MLVRLVHISVIAKHSFRFRCLWATAKDRLPPCSWHLNQELQSIQVTGEDGIVNSILDYTACSSVVVVCVEQTSLLQNN